ncbi:MAG: FtsX-like permease family protein [Prolixibacteraceae bacterium]|jgi:putative ABC transport system permease protein|nr:FtsX-like permease family protein [Prolixibacteraceae bacterium]MBT6999023.1 FtsX-like permease family protein [Prolixibacteraceae bacterium]MBT7394478.1 FtsX-like permease family protein [Prolixibacteraceae bacterium]
MTKLQYIFKTFAHYFKANLLVALGVAISTMVLTGSLIIGDSVRYSLEQATFSRLGETTHLVSVVERYFRQEMAAEIELDNPEIKATPILLLEGIAVADGGQLRANKVQIVGVNSDFTEVAKSSLFAELQDNEIAISQNLAERLQITEGDNILVRIKKASLIPMNAPFISDEETSVSLRASVKKVVQREEMGRFSLKNSQTAPYNIFVSIGRLNQLMEFEGKANQLLISTELETEKVAQSVKNCLTPADAGLSLKNIESTHEIEVSTERVFLEDKVSETLKMLPDADLILTYFVNGIARSSKPETQSQSIPYSFVSSLENKFLGDNEIIINQWAADDLKAKIGDSIRIKYLEIGPLRKLIEKESAFILKEIISMDSEWSDPSRVPHLPGLSDAGHCREWEAGVPIDLDAIRDKDEDYWNKWQGTPKAFISHDKALEMWSNRFGNYTAVRFRVDSFNEDKYNQIFAEEIVPGDLGMAIEPIREQGIHAAQNGTDFSGLFIGLSFFILVASIVLTSLLFRLNLETRSAQVGLLAALGFQQNMVRRFYLFEGLAISLVGGIIGLLASVFYTQLVFKILNSLWFEIVRTNVLEINILPATLITGLLISILVSLVAIFTSIRRYQNQRAADLQKQTTTNGKSVWNKLKDIVMYASIVISVVIFVKQVFLSEQLNPSLFFLTGGLLLIGLLMIFGKILVRLEHRKQAAFGFGKLAQLNLTRNKGRSLTVIILFALGTFLVVSTGSNKLDLVANSSDKSSGTGGFNFFAETTIPVLFNINDADKRAEEGIYTDFNAVQLRKVEGDDASCLNLNRIAQPALLGVDAELLQGRFSFATQFKEIGDEEPWEVLNQKFDDGTIPAIADQTVIQWGLGMKVGDILMYQNELGDTLRLKLIAGTTPSIFQGFVIISNQHFLENYPTSSGSNIFLVEGSSEDTQQISDELQSVFRDYGWEMETTAKRLVEFYSVTNTYLSIFLALGALGLILGTIGLAVILARTILERRREIAVMQAVGFSTNSIFNILIKEYLILLFTGVLIGFVTAVVATMPAFISTNSDASFSTVALVVGVILINGIIWIVGLSWFSLHKKVLVAGLRVE